MTKKVLHSAAFDDAPSLVDAINYLLSIVEGELVYIASNGFLHTGRVLLLEKTLTDGSTVHDMEIIPEGEEFP